MARASSNKAYTTFVRGLITEASELNYPENATSDELNCVIGKKGNRTRRQGIDVEASYTLSQEDFSSTTITEDALTTDLWVSVGGNGNLNFVVVQVGNTLLFYDTGSVPLSSGRKSFTVDLSTYVAAGASNTNLSQVEMASGKGYLFVVSEKIDPIYLTYDPSLDSITVNEIDIEIRDFDGVEDSLAIDERPSTLSILHQYNLYNQGWYIDDVRRSSGGSAISNGRPLDTFFSDSGTYPANKDVWWIMKDGNGRFTETYVEQINRGNTKAPNGHYILDPFYKDRTAASGIIGLGVESITSRPGTVAFYAGRVWYAGQRGADINDNIFYSQIIEDPKNIGKCYQTNDPTSEDLNSIIDTDGGVIVISDMGNVVKLVPVGDSLVIFATNGVWSVSGTDGGFKATDVKIAKITSVNAVSAKTIVDVEGSPVWWSDTGIYVLTPNQTGTALQEQSLSDTTIKSFYQDIPAISRLSAQGTYDRVSRKIQWIYNTTAPSDDDDRFKYNRVLNFDLDLSAFYPWSIEELATSSPQVSGIVSIPAITSAESTATVVSDTGDIVIDASGDTVVADISQSTALAENIKYLVVVLDGSTYEVTFGGEDNDDLMDWKRFDSTGIAFSSYLTTGYELFGDVMRFKQAPYVYTYVKENDDFSNHSLFLQGRWDFSNSGNSGKYTTKFQTYRDIGNTDTEVLVTRHKFRGKGKALQFNYTSEDQNKFDILGWAIQVSGNTEV